MGKDNIEKIFPVYKKIGQTPYQLVQEFRKQKKIPEDIKIAYAGRLDPMAEGVVLFVIGKKLTNFNNYLKIDKEYEADILFGFKTDTYDILGIPDKNNHKEVKIADIKKTILSQNKIFTFPLPPFSSYKINGKPLFYWAKKEKINTIEIPIKKIKINNLKIVEHYKLNEEEIKNIIIKKIKKVTGDFRQQEILDNWNKVLDSKNQQHFVVKIIISANSGFYVRSFVNKIGDDLSTSAVLFHLKRKRIGKYNIKDCIK